MVILLWKQNFPIIKTFLYNYLQTDITSGCNCAKLQWLSICNQNIFLRFLWNSLKFNFETLIPSLTLEARNGHLFMRPYFKIRPPGSSLKKADTTTLSSDQLLLSGEPTTKSRANGFQRGYHQSQLILSLITFWISKKKVSAHFS